MSYTIEFQSRPSYLFARVTGANTPDTVRAYMHDLVQKCEETACFRVLVHECLDGPRLSAGEVFELMASGSRRGLGKFSAIAFVDEEMGDIGRFAENVGVNRGMPLRVFDNVDEAAEWIEGLPSAPAADG